ncbi:MAG: hypothetical protein HZC12_00935 [Nitrospirae bacterium]|nr:hypothetical protein [Nitrospirota bacterium]
MDKIILRPEYFLLIFIGMWIMISIVISRVSGWGSLAEIYRYTDPFNGNRWRFQSAGMRWMMSYNNCLTIGSNERGLYLSIFFIFRFGHPPLFIPWNDISITNKKGLLFKYIEFRFRRFPSLFLRINKRVGERIVHSAHISLSDVGKIS